MSSSTPLPLPQLPPPIAEVLNSFLQSAKDALGPDLLSVVLFGSAAEGKLRATSDLNLILVLASFTNPKPTCFANRSASRKPPFSFIPCFF